MLPLLELDAFVTLVHPEEAREPDGLRWALDLRLSESADLEIDGTEIRLLSAMPPTRHSQLAATRLFAQVAEASDPGESQGQIVRRIQSTEHWNCSQAAILQAEPILGE